MVKRPAPSPRRRGVSQYCYMAWLEPRIDVWFEPPGCGLDKGWYKFCCRFICFTLMIRGLPPITQCELESQNHHILSKHKSNTSNYYYRYFPRKLQHPVATGGLPARLKPPNQFLAPALGSGADEQGFPVAITLGESWRFVLSGFIWSL